MTKKRRKKVFFWVRIFLQLEKNCRIYLKKPTTVSARFNETCMGNDCQLRENILIIFYEILNGNYLMEKKEENFSTFLTFCAASDGHCRCLFNIFRIWHKSFKNENHLLNYVALQNFHHKLQILSAPRENGEK